MSATRDNVQQRLADEQDTQLLHSSPDHDVFDKTAAYIMAVRKLGCQQPPQQKTPHMEAEAQEYQQSQETAQYF
jgi:hypothetical protein